MVMKDDRTSFLSIPVTTRHRDTGGSMDRSTGTVLPIESWLIRQLMRVFGEPAIRVLLWDGKEHYRSAHGPAQTTLRFKQRRAFWRLFTNPELRFGDGYCNGRIEVEGSLVQFLEAIFRARVERTRPSALVNFARRGFVRQPRNTPDEARDNIHHHYDLGNDFYKLWLDEELAYTCAYFADSAMTLEQAQIAKMDHVCRKLELRAGERVVEAGCGWGGLARHMARHYGVTVKAYNISHEQIAYARDRARAEGLEGRVEYIEDDYRAITGTYDVFASVGMLEHVGPHNYATLGALIDRVLTPRGRGLIHTIAQNRPDPTGAWTQKRLFPGGYTPTLRQMMDIFEAPGFSVLDVENIRLHYARTCEEWLTRFERNLETVRAMFDEFFIRAWRLYLSASIAQFRTGALQLYQVLFARPTLNDIAWTRARLYEPRPLDS
jgi:cyclopropane-fatty-acyl-phospholipid synthase